MKYVYTVDVIDTSSGVFSAECEGKRKSYDECKTQIWSVIRPT